MTPRGLRAHLAAFQSIAARNGGNRAAGTKGYAASARYVHRSLERAGYDVRYDEFPFGAYVVRVERARELRPTERDLAPDALSYSPSTPEGGLTTEVAVVPVDEDGSHGCEAGDFDGRRFNGMIALVRRGTCTFTEKARNAAGAGAVAVLIYNNVPGGFDGTLGGPDESSIPAAGVSRATGRALTADARKGDVVVSLEIEASSGGARSRNVIAELPGADAGPVVMLGGHLDSVEAGPGLNDNASGAAALLEIAEAVARLTPDANVRFAFWGAEELGLFGSRYYVGHLDRKERERIAVYLNFDMIGSPNGVPFVYDGGGTNRAGRASEAIERVFVAYFRARRVPVERRLMASGSDHTPFEDREIPTGGLFTGASDTKTPAQTRIFGGTAGAPYDPCYHRSCDTIRNIDVDLLHQMADAAAHALVTLAANPPVVAR